MLQTIKISKQPDGKPEIFYSIQGEGYHLGRPATFVRLAYCNLRCVWCDSKYTWDWKGKNPEEYFVEMNIDEAERAVAAPGCHHVVFTGGEPLVQQKSLTVLLERLKAKDYYIEVETNGSLLPLGSLAGMVDHWSVSPKLENSGNPRSVREVPECYQFFQHILSVHFKFVIDAPDDIIEVNNLVAKYGIRRERVYLMPAADNELTLKQKSVWLVEKCKENGYSFSTRLQITLWGNERGR